MALQPITVPTVTITVKGTMFTTCEYCKDTPARGRDERQMKGRRQEIEHIERMKNAELDLFKDKIADEVVGKMKKVKKVGAIKVVHGGGHKGENNQKRANRNQIEGNLGGGLNNALVPVQGQGAGLF